MEKNIVMNLQLLREEILKSIKKHKPLITKNAIKDCFTTSRDMPVFLFQSIGTKEVFKPAYDFLKQETKNIENNDATQKSEQIDKLKKINENKVIKGLNRSLFGRNYKKIDKLSNRLAGYVYYLDPGHGGIDPGAIGYREGYELTEDE